MTVEKQQFTYFSAGEVRVAKAWRNDRSWGPAIDVEISDLDGRVLNRVTFACHPEFSEFDVFRAKATEELLAIARERLESGRYEAALSSARTDGLALVLRFNSPDQT